MGAGTTLYIICATINNNTCNINVELLLSMSSLGTSSLVLQINVISCPLCAVPLSLFLVSWWSTFPCMEFAHGYSLMPYTHVNNHSFVPFEE